MYADILCEIAKRLPDLQTCYNFALVCKKFRAAFRQNQTFIINKFIILNDAGAPTINGLYHYTETQTYKNRVKITYYEFGHGIVYVIHNDGTKFKVNYYNGVKHGLTEITTKNKFQIRCRYNHGDLIHSNNKVINKINRKFSKFAQLYNAVLT